MTLPLRLLALIGRYGTQGFALSIFLGLALPQFAAAARPLLGVCIFLFLVLTFARADLAAVRAVLYRPVRLAGATLWLLAAPALTIGVGLALVGRDTLDPGLVLGLAILGAAPPILSAPAVAILLGLEPTLLLTATVVATVGAPLYAPFVADLVAGAGVPLDASALALRLAAFIGGAVTAAAILRAVAGRERLRRHAPSIDGAGVVLYFVFAVAAMDGVTAAAVERPALVASFLAVAFAVGIGGLLVASVALAFLGPGDRFALGYATGHRNMGLLVAALGPNVPETTFLFFALAQFPIYLMPQLVKPFARRIAARDAIAGREPAC